MIGCKNISATAVFYKINMEYAVTSGTFDIKVRDSSCDCDLQKVVITVTQ